MPETKPHTNPTELAALKVAVLAGGVGGAKLADGFAQLLPPENLTVIVNTGDDFRHMGLMICPDLDTVTYTLAGEANPDTGWGRKDETWRTMAEVVRLGGPEWFRLGDLDLATHLRRTHLLAQGQTLTQATASLCHQFHVAPTVLPMSDEPAPTLIETTEGILSFQSWFVEKQWQPAVEAVHLPEDVRATSRVIAALEVADWVVLAPSNPFVSIDPILNVYPIRNMIEDMPEVVIAVSPLIQGEAVKGPAAKMMREMGFSVTSQAVAGYYNELIDVFVHDTRDQESIAGHRHQYYSTDTLMRNRRDRLRLAQEIADYTRELINR